MHDDQNAFSFRSDTTLVEATQYSIFFIPTLDLQHDFVFTIQLAYRIFLRFIFLWEEVPVPTAQIQHYCL